MRIGIAAIRTFNQDIFEKDNIHAKMYQVSSQKVDGMNVGNGMYVMSWNNHGFRNEEHIRFSLVIKDGRIVTDYSSVEPIYDEPIDNLPEAYSADYRIY